MTKELTFAQRAALVDADEAAKRAATPRGVGGTPFTAGNGYVRRFPTDRLPPQMRDYCHDIAVRMQVPVDLPALTMLGILGVMAGPRFLVRRDLEWVQPTNLYTACGMDSGAGKTPTVDELRKGLWKARRILEERHADRHAKRVVALQKEIHDKKDAANNIHADIPAREPLRLEAEALQAELDDLVKDPPKPKLLIEGDITTEHLLEKMADNSGVGAIVDDEGTFFRIIAGLYSNGKVGNIGLLLKGFDCHYYDQGRVGNGRKASREVERAALSLVLTPQPGILASVLRDQMMNDTGFINRFIVCLPGDLVGMREGRPSTFHDDVPAERVDLGHRRWWADLLAGLAEYDVIVPNEDPDAPEPVTVNLTRAAWKRNTEYGDEFERRCHPETGILRDIRAWGSKHLARVLRIAALLHLAAGKTPADEIDEATMEDAIGIGEWTIDHYFAAGGVAGLSEDAGRIKEFVDGSEYGFVERAEIYTKVFNRRIPAVALDKGIAELVATGDYWSEKRPTGGAPKRFVGRAGAVVPVVPVEDGPGDED